MLPSGDDAQIAADLVSHACLRVQISNGPRRLLISMPAAASP